MVIRSPAVEDPPLFSNIRLLIIGPNRLSIDTRCLTLMSFPNICQLLTYCKSEQHPPSWRKPTWSYGPPLCNIIGHACIADLACPIGPPVTHVLT